MLQKIRDKSSGWVAGIIVGLLVLTFALFGINSYFGQGTEPVVATVNDTEIKSGQFQRALYNLRQQMQNLTGQSVPADDPAFRNEALQRIIDIEIMNQSTQSYGLAVSDLRVYETINRLETFQNDQGFDQALYQRTLNSMGMTEPAFENQIRNDMKAEQLQSAVAESAFTVPAEVKRLARIRQQSRTFNYAIIPVSDHVDDIEVTENEIVAFYEENRSQFVQPEQVRIGYIELTLDKVAERIEIAEDEIKNYFEANRINYIQPERRQIWQAKIKASDTEALDGDGDALALEKAEEIAGVFKSDADFVKVAEEYSSAPDSDILVTISESGEMQRGVLKQELDDILFTMSVGDVSEPVKSGDSYHVLKLVAIKEAEEKEIEDVREQVERDLRRQLAGKEYFEIAEQLAALAYEHPDTLELAADATDLEIQESDFFTSEGGNRGLTAERKVVTASFSEDVLLNGHNSDAIELDPERMVVLRVIERKAEGTKPLDDVRGDITEFLKTRMAAEKVHEISQAILEKLDQGMTLNEAAGEYRIEMQRAEGVDRDDISVNRSVLRTAFRMPAPDTGESRVDSVTMGDGDVAVIELTGIASAGELKGRTLDSVTAELRQLRAETEWNGLFDQLKSEADIRILESNL
jgi:peptidyl-prolyl cis-trans isomerase D